MQAAMNGLNTNPRFTDITESFKSACDQLQVGELLHDASFGLFEAMSAFEMMDPKMDAGMTCVATQKSPKTFASALDNGDIKLRNIGCDEQLQIIDGTFICFASWIEGSSLAQTLFANLYLHNSSLIEDRIMKAFCVGMLKLVDKIRELTTISSVYEEEHFQPMTYGFKLAEEVTCGKVLGMLKETEDELGKMVRQHRGVPVDPGSKHDPAAITSSLQMRVRLLRTFLAFVLVVKYENNCPEDSTQLIKRLKETLATIAAEDKISWVDNPLFLPAFDTSSTSRLLPPSFPRHINLMTFGETIAYFQTTVELLDLAMSMPTDLGLVTVMDYFDYLTLKSPSVLVRSVMLYNFLPSQPCTKVLSKTKLTDAIADEMREFNCPPPVSSSYKGILMAHKDVQAMFNSFLINAAHVVEGLFSAKCNNRARQRERLAVLLDDMGVLQTEADRTDTLIDTILRDRFGDKALNHLAAGIGTWTLYLTTKSMITYLTLGMELELYDVREYGYVFWYLYEILYSWYASSMCRAENCLTEVYAQETKGAKKKGKPKKSSRNTNLHQRNIYHARTYQTLCGGYHYLLQALKHTDTLPTTGDYKYDNEEVRFSHRFAPFGAVSTPAVVSYRQYAEVTRCNQKLAFGQVMELMAQAYRNFQQVKVMLESDNFKDCNDATALLNIVKNNIVVTKILADSWQKEHRRSVKFEFKVHSLFPMIKLA